jgi:hypothetical protein
MISIRRIPAIPKGINKFVTGKDIAVLSLNNPPVNSLNPALFSDLTNALKEIKQDKQISGLILKSSLSSVFSAGLDLSYVMIKPGETDPKGRLRAYFSSFQEIIREMLQSSMPTGVIVGYMALLILTVVPLQQEGLSFLSFAMSVSGWRVQRLSRWASARQRLD